MGDDDVDIHARERAFHRAYQRRNMIAYFVVGLVAIAAGAAAILWMYLSPMTEPGSIHSESYQRGQWVEIMVIGGGACLLVGPFALFKGIRLARNLDRPTEGDGQQL